MPLQDNWEFEEATKSGWENSEKNPNGDLPPPEWSEQVAEIWKYGDDLETAEEWGYAFLVLTQWRAYHGIQPEVDVQPIVIEPQHWEMCTESGAEQARQYAETIAKISGDPYYEYLYPALDEVVAWMDEMWIIKNSDHDWEDWEEKHEGESD